MKSEPAMYVTDDLEAVSKRDKRYFEQHPEVNCFVRLMVVGEFPVHALQASAKSQNATPTCMTVVAKVSDEIRLKAPLLKGPNGNCLRMPELEKAVPNAILDTDDGSWAEPL